MLYRPRKTWQRLAKGPMYEMGWSLGGRCGKKLEKKKDKYFPERKKIQKERVCTLRSGAQPSRKKKQALECRGSRARLQEPI